MKKLLIDSRVRKVEYEYLSRYFDVIKLPLSDDVYEEISGHSDIFYCKLQNKIICAPNAPIREKEFTVGKNLVGRTYPYDVSYNACQIGDKVKVMETRPLSKDKRWRVVEIMEKANIK